MMYSETLHRMLNSVAVLVHEQARVLSTDKYESDAEKTAVLRQLSDKARIVQSWVMNFDAMQALEMHPTGDLKSFRQRVVERAGS